jgi:predicted transcriptional regulator
MFYMKSTARKLTALRIDQSLLDKLAKIGVKQDRTTSYLIRKAVEEFVARHGDKS